MTVGSVGSSSPSRLNVSPPASSNSVTNPWIINSWVDQLFIVSTPIVVLLVVYFFYSMWLGVEAETIALVVTAFFALGHHLPGMIRAYGDRELFQRFRWRFILTPPLLFAVFFPLYLHHNDVFALTIMVWACWHGLMQLYGFVRIYDLKVGSTSIATAYLDWLMCLCWFVTAQIYSRGKLSSLLERWYSIGGPLILPASVQAIRVGMLGLCCVVTIGFLANSVYQTVRGHRPNPIKLLMLASGIGFWWFAMVFVENIILGAALFEITHDVQYAAIVWVYNCRRVTASNEIGRFMKTVFRRGMVLLYLSLIVAYGALGLVPGLVQNESIKTLFTGIIWTSTIMHFYYDGFIWKVREKSTRASLGVNDASRSAASSISTSGMTHLLKWSPALIYLSWLFFTDMTDRTISTKRIDELREQYTRQLQGSAQKPKDVEEQSWLMSEFARVQNIAAAVPDDPESQRRAAIALANFGRNDEAIQALEQQTQRTPNFSAAHLSLGEINLYRGNFAQAEASFEHALACAKKSTERANSHLRLGELHLRQGRVDQAKSDFQKAIQQVPKLNAEVEALRKLKQEANDQQ